MSNNEILVTGIIIIMLTGITLVASPMFEVFSMFTGLESEKAYVVLIIGFVTGIGITIIGFKTMSRK